MATIKVDFDQPYDEFEICGETYRAYYDDDSLRKYEKIADKFYKESKKKGDIAKMSAQQKKSLENKQYKAIEETIEGFFGEGSFKPIYEASGRSMLNITQVLEAVFEWLNSKVQNVNKKAAEYYTKSS
ncbi:hypothetical protein ACE1TI_13490 [Alteribacillus sp. JSM 102045]|uniref:hypothetical protein n=1 Tax=Alteribacillus sp. JSM 102045 TaxID=1562101 RepID=UPI0035BF5E5A